MASLKEAEADVKASRVRNYDDFLKELRQTGEIQTTTSHIIFKKAFHKYDIASKQKIV